MFLDQVQDCLESAVTRQITLADVAVDNDLGPLALPGQKHLHLWQRGVLSFVKNDQGVGKAATTHGGKRYDLDVASPHRCVELALTHTLPHWGQEAGRIRLHLFLEITWQEPDITTGWYIRTGDDDLVDCAVSVLVSGVGSSDKRLACSSWAKNDNSIACLQCVEIISLLLCLGL